MRLNADAKATLKAAGISQADWAREHFGTTTWRGDACGCPDDRCTEGFHHEAGEGCGCLLYRIGLPRTDSPRAVTP
jgi:hypothetical protein